MDLTPDELRARVAALEAAGAAARAEADALRAERDALAAELAGLRPPAGAAVPTDAFRERLAPALLRLAGAPPELRDKWDRVLSQLLPHSKPAVNLASPTTRALVAVAVADGLLTEAEAAAAVAH